MITKGDIVNTITNGSRDVRISDVEKIADKIMIMIEKQDNKNQREPMFKLIEYIKDIPEFNIDISKEEFDYWVNTGIHLPQVLARMETSNKNWPQEDDIKIGFIQRKR